MTKQDIAIIERIVRQSFCGGPDHPEEDKFAGWLSVDQGQFLELIEHIPNRVSPGPLRDLFATLHLCAAPDCLVHICKTQTFCYEHATAGSAAGVSEREIR